MGSGLLLGEGEVGGLSSTSRTVNGASRDIELLEIPKI